MTQSPGNNSEHMGILNASGADLDEMERRSVEAGVPVLDAGDTKLSDIREASGEEAKAAAEPVNSQPEPVEPTPTDIVRVLDPEQEDVLLDALMTRFIMNRQEYGLHEKTRWPDVEKALHEQPEKLWSLWQMEETGGEPDVIEENRGGYIFGDCSAESPAGRRNVVFDWEAEKYLKAMSLDYAFNGNATDLAAEYGAELMSEEYYCTLRKKLSIDAGTVSWLKTPGTIRKTGFAICGCDKVDGVIVKHFGRAARKHARAGLGQRAACGHSDTQAFRAVLCVPKAKKAQV
jgi:hypothetical protein